MMCMTVHVHKESSLCSDSNSAVFIEMARDDAEVAVEQLCTVTAAMWDKV